MDTSVSVWDGAVTLRLAGEELDEGNIGSRPTARQRIADRSFSVGLNLLQNGDKISQSGNYLAVFSACIGGAYEYEECG